MMPKRISLIFLFAFLVLAACAQVEVATENDGEVTEAITASESQPTPLPSFTEESIDPGQQQAYSFLSSSGQEMDYLIYLPADYDEAQTWPLILYLHGSSTSKNIETVRNKNPLAWIDPDTNFPFILVAPQSQTGFWHKYFEPMNELLAILPESLSIDSNAIFLTGASAGGYGAWRYAFANPDLFTAVAPIAGVPSTSTANPSPEKFCELKDLPIWVAHSEADIAVPIEMNMEAVAALEECGSTSIRFTTYTDLNHLGTITTVYAGPEIYDWMFEQMK
jgi:predicted peptidase